MTTSFLAGSEGDGCTTIVLLLVGSERDGCMTTALLAGSEGGGCKGEGRLYDDCVEKVFTNHLHFDRFDNGTPYFWL